MYLFFYHFIWKKDIIKGDKNFKRSLLEGRWDMLKSYQLRTKREEMVDITSLVEDCLEESEVQEGICLVYCPHTTGAISVNENTDPAVQEDIFLALQENLPDNPNFNHLEGNSRAHLLSSLFGASQGFIIQDGRLLLGTWQGIYFLEFDGPRTRSFYVKTLGDK